MTKSDAIKKSAMIEALIKSLGIVTTACKQVDISRQTHYRWYNEDAEYKKAVDDVADVALDFAESKLHTLIDKGDTSANIFYLKTKGKKRGYKQPSGIRDLHYTSCNGESEKYLLVCKQL